jgi:hypothetical protein
MPAVLRELTWEEFWPHPYYHHVSTQGWDASEEAFSELAKLWPCLFFALFFFCARAICKKFVFVQTAKALGVKGHSKIGKFGYQFWLLIAYSSSTIYGIWACKDQDFWGWPIDSKASIALWYPTERLPAFAPTATLWFYYWWGTGFYLSELFAIFVEPKRSDFVEYFAHHVTTLLLLTFSTAFSFMRIGVMILLLHDITDIFLCAAKLLHYAHKEFLTNVFFVIFVVSFAYLRLYCFPFLWYSSMFQGPNVRSVSYGYYPCVYLMLVLQVLHVYWFALVVKMVVRILTGIRGDVRSDDDDEEQEKARLRKAEKEKAAKLAANNKSTEPAPSAPAPAKEGGSQPIKAGSPERARAKKE